jgi:Ca-activated chloride channel homolog
MIKNLVFEDPEWLLLLLLLPIWWYWYIKYSKDKQPFLRFSGGTNDLEVYTWRIFLLKTQPFLRLLALIFLLIGLARPQWLIQEENIDAEGIDIVLVMDLSSSMLAQDFSPDRLEVSKKVASDFVGKRTYDRIALTVFAGEAFTMCPLTTDHKVVRNFLSELNAGQLKDGTAIGMGLATAVNRLKDSESKSKVVILLTDGVNNEGYIKPLTAAEIAREFGIKVYTIGVGSTGDALTPISRRNDGRYVFGLARVEIDEELLQEISVMTGGTYYRATNEKVLQEVYAQIDQLEKTRVEITTIKRFEDQFEVWLGISLLLLIIEVSILFGLSKITL